MERCRQQDDGPPLQLHIFYAAHVPREPNGSPFRLRHPSLCNGDLCRCSEGVLMLDLWKATLMPFRAVACGGIRLCLRVP